MRKLTQPAPLPPPLSLLHCIGLEKSLCKEREQLSQLQGDFNYNLSLLSARDKELAHYETSFKELKRVVNDMVAENSELKV